MISPESASVRIYVSSADADSGLRKELCEALLPWAQGRGARIWHRALLAAGMQTSAALDELARAEVVLLILSAGVFSDDRSARELDLALARHMRGETRVIPVLARPFLWRSTPVQSLAILPSNERPVISWPVREEAWLDVVTGVAQVVEELTHRPAAPEASPKDALRAENIAERLAASNEGTAEGEKDQGAFESEAWLFERCAKGDHAALRERAARALDAELRARLDEMAREIEAGRWPSGMAPALLRLQRTSAGWQADVRLGFLGQVCSISLYPGTRAPLGAGASLQADEEDGQLVVRLAARAGSALRGTRARVQAGVRSFTKWLVPQGTGALGTADHTESTLLELTLSSTEEEPLS